MVVSESPPNTCCYARASLSLSASLITPSFLAFFLTEQHLSNALAMTRLSKQDNDTLRKQEWQLLFGAQVAAISGSLTSTITSAGPPQEGLPSENAQDTFLVKTFFSETEMYYLILLTNLKQCWYEKLEIEDIRKRSQVRVTASQSAKFIAKEKGRGELNFRLGSYFLSRI